MGSRISKRIVLLVEDVLQQYEGFTWMMPETKTHLIAEVDAVIVSDCVERKHETAV